ncbi:hypothetical protein C9374_005770 [Naegleria lovaniensis]|uniref:Symplekin n=1 Tax=Naegleria lovaniensis TaxID=51637 RepID=A0AA88KJL3_NAELO|nr:uncharacterized protein C9374_005770 [Naegleria lovaniensis]KAG2381978.1 hypothetical protein C9374_005770 [Naegleria lovaniensis]
MLALNQTSSSGMGQRNKLGGASGGVGGRRGNISGSTSFASGGSQHAASRSHHQKLLQLIEFIKLETNKDKLNHYLSQVEEILANNADSDESSNLVNEFLTKILQLQHKHKLELQLFHALLIEKVMNNVPYISLDNAKTSAETLSLILVSAENTNLLKRIITSCIALVRKTIELIALNHDTQNKHITILYSHMNLLIKRILKFLEDDNEGVQSHAVHFAEHLILMYSSMFRNVDVEEDVIMSYLSYLQLSGNTYQVKQIERYPIDLAFVLRYSEGRASLLNVEEMRNQGADLLNKIVQKCAKGEIPASVMSVIIQSLLNIAKQRPDFWKVIIPFLCQNAKYSIENNYRISNSQKSALKCILKTVMLFLLRMPETKLFRDTIVNGLISVGVNKDTYNMIIRFVEKHTAVLKRKQDEAQTTVPERDNKMRKTEVEPSNQSAMQITGQPKQEEATAILYIGYIPRPLTNIALADEVLKNLSSITGSSNANRQSRTLESSSQLVNTILSTLSTHYYKRGTNTYTSEQQQQYMSSVQSFLAEPIPSFNSSMVTVSILGQAQGPYQQPRPSPYAVQTPYGRQARPSPYSKSVQQPATTQKVDPRLAQVRDPRQQLQSTYVPDKSKAFSTEKKLPAKAVTTAEDSDEEVDTFKPTEAVQDKIAEPVIEEEMKENLSKQFKLKLSIIDDNVKTQLKQFNWNKMLLSEKSMKREGKDHYRVKLICMMASKSEETADQYQQLLKFIKEDTKGRFGLLLMWLYMEYKNVVYAGYNVKTEEGEEPDNRYTRLFHHMLQHIEKSESTLSKLVVQCPHITVHAIEYLCKDLCETDNYISYGLMALRDITIFRQPLKQKCLDLLLNYSVHENSKIRTASIQILRDRTFYKLFETEINTFAYTNIKNLKNLLVKEEIKSEEMVDEDQEMEDIGNVNQDTIKRYSSLYLSLSTSYCESMFNQLIGDVYVEFKQLEGPHHDAVVSLLEKDILSTVKLSSNRPTVIEYLNHFDEKHCLDISIKIIQQLSLQAQGIDEALCKVLIHTFFDRNIKDPRLVLPIMLSLSKEQVKEALPVVVKSINDIELLKKCVLDLLNANPKGEKTDKATPDEILVVLHEIDANNETQSLAFNNARTLLDLCLNGDGKKQFTKHILMTALQQLADMPTLPKLIMRTVIQSLNLHNDLSQFIIKFIFTTLINRKAYESRNILTGMSKCLSEKLNLFPVKKVSELLADLGEKSEQALMTVLQNQNLRETFKEWLTIQQHPKRSRYFQLIDTLSNNQQANASETK